MMSRVPLLYFSRGQLESLDWPDPVVAPVLSTGDAKSARMTITHGSKGMVRSFILWVSAIVGTAGASVYKTLGQYAKAPAPSNQRTHLLSDGKITFEFSQAGYCILKFNHALKASQLL